MRPWIVGYLIVGCIVGVMSAVVSMDMIADEEEMMAGLLRAVLLWPVFAVTLLVLGGIELLARWKVSASGGSNGK